MRAEIIRRAKSGLLDDDELQLVITEQIEEDPAFWTGSGKSRTVINVEVNCSTSLDVGTLHLAPEF